MTNIEKLTNSTESVPEENYDGLPEWRLDIAVFHVAEEIQEREKMRGTMKSQKDIDLQKQLIQDLRKKLVEIVSKYPK